MARGGLLIRDMKLRLYHNTVAISPANPLFFWREYAHKNFEGFGLCSWELTRLLGEMMAQGGESQTFSYRGGALQGLAKTDLTVSFLL